MAQVTARMPIVETDGTLVTVVVGKPEAEFGDEVNVEAVFDRKRFESLYVASVDTSPANEIAPDVLALFGMLTVYDLLALLERRYGTGLPHDVPLTIYTFVDQPVEESIWRAIDE